MQPTWLRESTVFSSSRLKVIAAKLRFHQGPAVEWHYAQLPGGIAVLPISDNGTVALTQEWRLAWKREVLQIPAGVCTGRSEAARRAQVHQELREEIGVDARQVTKLGTYYAAVSVRLQPHIYLAQRLFRSPLKRDANEIVKIIHMPFRKAYSLITSGKIVTSSHTLIAFLMARDRLNL